MTENKMKAELKAHHSGWHVSLCSHTNVGGTEGKSSRPIRHSNCGHSY